MKNKELSDLIGSFARKQSGAFKIDALVEYVSLKEAIDEDEEERLYELACESVWLFEDDRDLFEDWFVPRYVAFKGAEFLVKPLESEVEGGYLVPGHRFNPFVSRDVFPGEVELLLPDRSSVPTRKIRLSVEEFQPFVVFLGQYVAIDYLLLDSEENMESLHPPFDGSVSVTVFDFAEFFEQCGFKTGDSLMLTVEDWLEGRFSIRHVSEKNGTVDFARTQEWRNALNLGLEGANLDAGLDHDCTEQMARMLWYAECDEDLPSVLSNPPLSLAAFFNMQKDLEIKTMGQVTFFWPKDESLETRMLNSMTASVDEPESGLDGYFGLLGLSLDSEDAQSYMRDALSRGGKNPDQVLKRAIQGRALHFPTMDEQDRFNQLWRELWDEVRASYDPSRDHSCELRSRFLDLNDQSLAILRELDRKMVNPSDLMNNQDYLRLGELSSLIHSVLIMCNEDDVKSEDFPLPLDEMAKDISAAISELSKRL